MVALAARSVPRDGGSDRSAILGHPLFAGVDAAAVAHVLDRLGVITVEKGQSVTGPVSPRRCLYLVLTGTLHPFILTPDGRRLLLEIVGPGGFDGLLLASGSEGHFCEAASTAEVVAISNTILGDLIDADPRVARNLLDLTLQRLARREAHMSALTQGEGLRRVAQQLVAIGRYAGRTSGPWVELEPRPTHQTLSEMMGLRRETVTLQLGALRRRGAVEVLPRVLRLHLGRLGAIAEGSSPHVA